jgi:Glycosyl hydrolase family 12
MLLRGAAGVLALTPVGCASGEDDPAIGTTPSSSSPVDAPPAEPNPLGAGVMVGMGQSSAQFAKAGVKRDGVNYTFMANGWGPGFAEQTVSWNGSAFTVVSMQGTQGDNYEPATYPTVFCGTYSRNSSQPCGLPAAISNLTQLRTGWRWDANGNVGEYNAAYDIWLGQNGMFTSFFMVWLRDPPGQQPAGSPTVTGITVSGVPGVWDIWTGEVNNAPITNYVAAEGQDVPELEFDVLHFFADAAARGIAPPGTEVLAVAVGFEIWNGPVTDLRSLDFYVDANTL